MLGVGALASFGHDGGSKEGTPPQTESLYTWSAYLTAGVYMISYLDNHIWQLLYI